MSHKPENERLLADIFSESAQAGFRGAMLSQTLGLARRRRRWRQARKATALLAVLGLMGGIVWKHSTVQPTTPMASDQSKFYTLIHTRPLSKGDTVTSHPLSPEQVVSSAATTVEIVQTSHNHFRLINDDELLAMAAPRSVVLVRLGQHSEQLVFSNPAEEEGFWTR